MSEQKAFELKIDEQDIAWLSIDVPGEKMNTLQAAFAQEMDCLLYTSPSPRDVHLSRMPSSA